MASKDSAQTYREYRDELKAKQEGLPREVIAEQMERKSEYSLDLENLPGQDHHWVDRGVVVSCEGAGHDNHQFYKRR